MLTLHLTGSSWRAVRKAHADFTLTPDTIAGEVVAIVDGDTVRIGFEGKVELVRLRGVDAPESRPSDKVERDLDRAGHDDEREFALGAKATAWLAERLVPGTAVELSVERRADGSLVRLNGFRLLAYVGAAGGGDSDLGLAMIEAGQALVWPRNKKSRRYQHPRLAEYLQACNAASEGRPGLWSEGLAGHCPAVQAGEARCNLSDL